MPDLLFRDNRSGGKNGKKQRYGFVNTWNKDILLCAVTEVYRRQGLTRVKGSGSECRLYTGRTWISVGKPGKQTRRKMVLTETVNLRKSSLCPRIEKAVAKTVVWNTERKCFAWEFSARATNTLQIFAYETTVFLECGENIVAAKAIFFSMEY